MDNLNLVSTFAEFKELKNIDKSTMIGVLEDVFRHLLIKTYETDENFDVIINPEKGDLEIWRNRTIVEDGTVENPNQQISLTDARKIDSTYEVGEEVAEEIKLADFGRRAVLSLRQNLASRIMDLEKANLFNKYTEKVGEIITGEVYQVWKKEILVLDDDDNELVLPKSEQIPSDFFRKGESVKAIVARVEMKNNSPYIVLSRTAPEFLERLFEMEVPEIYDGLITIKKIARIPGERAKVAVESYDERIDPVGACVGVRGSRIQNIVQELRGERIDIVVWSPEIATYARNALAPALVSRIVVDEEENLLEVIVPDDQLTNAIGRKGQNVKLAARLLGWKVDIFTETRYNEANAIGHGLEQVASVAEVSIEALLEAGYSSLDALREASDEELADKLTISASRISDLRSAINFLAPVVESTPESSAVELGRAAGTEEAEDGDARPEEDGAEPDAAPETAEDAGSGDAEK